MKKAISFERWQQAQAAEKKIHEDAPRPLDYYQGVYRIYFKYVEINRESPFSNILEVGPAEAPALAFLDDLTEGYVCEPDPSPRLLRICGNRAITVLDSPLETLPELKFEEVWLFNVMQHIIDPEQFVNKCKEMAKIIRYFEPIDQGTTLYHPHEYGYDDFYRWFGCKNIYSPAGEPNFHTAHCVYGIWRKND